MTGLYEPEKIRARDAGAEGGLAEGYMGKRSQWLRKHIHKELLLYFFLLSHSNSVSWALEMIIAISQSMRKHGRAAANSMLEYVGHGVH